MKALAVVLFAVLSVALHADVILDNPPPAKPPVKRKKPAVVKTETTATTSTTATTTAVTTTTVSPAPTPVTTSTAAPAPTVPVEKAATIPEKRRISKFPFGALTAVGIALIVAITASRRKRQGQ